MLFIYIPIIFFIILFFFSSQKLSPIPYFPTNSKDIELVVKALNLKNDQVIYDLGAGSGIVVFHTAKYAFDKNLTTKFVAVEINPFLIAFLYLRRAFHPNKKNIHIVWADIFKMNYQKLSTYYSLPTTYYLYISPWLMKPLITKLKKDVKRFALVSYYYEVPGLGKIKYKIKGFHPIFIYEVS